MQYVTNLIKNALYSDNYLPILKIKNKNKREKREDGEFD